MEDTDYTKPKTRTSQFLRTLCVTILLGLLLVSLAIWGVSDAFRPNTENAAALVGKEKVLLSDFSRAFQNELSAANQQNPQNRLTNERAYQSGMHQNVLNGLITQVLLQLDADFLGLGVNRRDVRQYIEDLGIANNAITGKFDEAVLTEKLSQLRTGQTRSQFEDDIYNALRSQQNIDALLAGISVPKHYGYQFHDYLYEQRNVSLLSFTAQAIKPAPTPTQEELTAFIVKNIQAFQLGERRRLTILHIDPSDIAPDVQVNEAEIKDLYDLKLKTKKIGTDETRSFWQFIAPDEAIAQKLKQSLDKGTGIEEARKEVGLNAPIAYENVRPDAVTDPDAAEAGFTMQTSETRIVQSALGTWYVLLVSHITPATKPEITELVDTLRTELQNEKIAEIIYTLQEDIQKSLDEGARIEDVSALLQLPFMTYGFMTQTGQTAYGTNFAGLNENTQFAPGIAQISTIMREAFLADLGFESDVFDTQSLKNPAKGTSQENALTGIAVVRVDEIRPARALTIDDKGVRARAQQAWQAQYVHTRLQELTASLATKLTPELSNTAKREDTVEDTVEDIVENTVGNQDIAKTTIPTFGPTFSPTFSPTLASIFETLPPLQKKGAKYQTKTFTRSAPDLEWDAPFTNRLFSSAQGQTLTGLSQDKQTYMIAHIDTITPINPNDLANTGGREAIVSLAGPQMRDLLASDVQQSYRRALIRRYRARIIDDNIKLALGIEKTTP